YNISAVIEPISDKVIKNYFLDSYSTALKAILEIGSPNLKLLLVERKIKTFLLCCLLVESRTNIVNFCSGDISDWLSNELFNQSGTPTSLISYRSIEGVSADSSSGSSESEKVCSQMLLLPKKVAYAAAFCFKREKYLGFLPEGSTSPRTSKKGFQIYMGIRSKGILREIEDNPHTSEPVLGLFDEKAPTVLHADASGYGLKDLSGRLASWALPLQEYDLEIVYKSRKKHKDADSLSRNPVEGEVFPSEQKTNLASFSDIAEEQRKDLELSKLIHTHEKVEPVTKSFNLIDGILCKKNFDPNGRKWLPIIPKHLSLEILQHFNDASTAGHLGFAKTYNRIQKRFFWPGLYRSVHRYFIHCRECQRRKSVPQKPPGLLIPIPPASVPFQRISIDLLGKFPRSTKGNKWIIVCTDYLSRFAVTKALPTAKAEEVAKFITEEIVLKHGAP
ncbi:transposon Ty3-I Gag-Pol polyprotein, partial [Trichonephila inaurata madagascariensis]